MSPPDVGPPGLGVGGEGTGQADGAFPCRLGCDLVCRQVCHGRLPNQSRHRSPLGGCHSPHGGKVVFVELDLEPFLHAVMIASSDVMLGGLEPAFDVTAVRSREHEAPAGWNDSSTGSPIVVVVQQRDLILLAQRGDHAAFGDLAASAISRLHRTARLILRDDERASDAVQDALTSAWLDIRAIRDPDRWDAWLHRLLVRACYREAERHRRQRTVPLSQSVVEIADAPGDGREVALRDELDRAFGRLTPDLRAVLVAHHYLGLRDAEAAAMLGVPAGTYKSRLHRATSAIRAALEAEERTPSLTREVTT